MFYRCSITLDALIRPATFYCDNGHDFFQKSRGELQIFIKQLIQIILFLAQFKNKLLVSRISYLVKQL